MDADDVIGVISLFFIICFVLFMACSWWHGLNLIFIASPTLGFISIFLEGSQNVVAWADWCWHVDLARSIAEAFHIVGR